MKKLITVLITFFISNITSAQYTQIPGEPCFFERYTSKAQDEECNLELVDIETKEITGEAQFVILDDASDTIIFLLPDPDDFEVGYIEGEATIGSKYTVFNGHDLTALEYSFINDEFIDDYKEDSIEEPEYFYVTPFNNKTFYIIKENSKESYLINITKISSQKLTYDILSNFKPKICIPGEISFLYSDSLFYNNDGLLTKRRRNNDYGDEYFDFISYYEYQENGELKKYFQTDYQEDTTQLEIRSYNDLGKPYILDKSTKYYKTVYELQYNTFGQITEKKEITIRQSDGDTSSVTYELFSFDENGIWETYKKVGIYGDTDLQQIVTKVLPNNSYELTEITFSYYEDNDTSYYTNQYVDNYFTEFYLEFPLKSSILQDKNQNTIASGINLFNEYGELEYSETIDHNKNPIKKISSDSVIYDYSDQGELLKRIVYRWNVSDQKYYVNSENIYFCHQETIGSYLGLDNDLDISLDIYPNPTSNFVTLESSSKIDKTELLNLDGTTLEQFDDLKINLTDYPSGVYLIKVFSEQNSKTFKIKKQ